MRSRIAVAVACLLTPAMASAQLGQAQAPSPSAQQQNQQILDELRQIRALLERLLAPSPPQAQQPKAPVADPVVKLTNVTGYVLGKPDAPLTMVEFSDLQCPYCRQFHVTAFDQLKKAYIDTGKLRYISRDFPLTSIHSFALDAARASRCAGEQGRFWDMRHAILATSVALRADSFVPFAATLKLNPKEFNACMQQTTRYDLDLQKDQQEGEKAGISATPSFVLGRTVADGVDGVLLIGAQPFQAFDAKLKALLATLP